MRWILLLLLLVSCEKEVFVIDTIYVDPQAEQIGYLELTNDYVNGTFMITTNDHWKIWDTIIHPSQFSLGETKYFELDQADYRVQLKNGNYYYSARITIYKDSTIYWTISAFGK